MNRIIITGDFFYDYEDVKRDVEDIFSRFIDDYVLINLEGTLCNTGKKIHKRGPNLCQSETTIELLKKSKVNAVCLANNHIMDYGDEGLQNTIKLLENNGIDHTGAGDNIENAVKPVCIDCCDNKIAFLNFGWYIEEVKSAEKNNAGCAPLDEKLIIKSIKKLIDQGYKPIVILHWGFEYNLYPQPVHRKLAHKIIDAGAEMVVGHHPHVIQGKELYKDKLIYYSLGNFYFGTRRASFKKNFDTPYGFESNYGIVLEISVEKSMLSVKENTVYYDSNKDVTELNTKKYVLDDYTKTPIDRRYAEKVNKYKKNVNPMLDGGRLDLLKLFIHQKIVRGIVRTIWVQMKKIRNNKR